MRRVAKYLAIATATAMVSIAGQGDALAQGFRGLSDDPGPRSSRGTFSGLYVGGQVGGIDDNIDFSFTDGTTVSGLGDDAVLLGGIVGYQYQISALVIGVESSFSATLGGGSSAPCPNPALTCSADIDSIFTVGGRIGLAFNTAMIYFAGGYANAGVDTNTLSGAVSDPVDDRLDGFYIGGGVDWMPVKNVVFGVEYRHYDFDAETFTSGLNPGDPASDRIVGADADSVTARLTFLFN